MSRKNTTRAKDIKVPTIRTWDDPVLKKVCSIVKKEDDISFILAMKKVLANSKNGVGLAAPQIGITKRVILVRSRVMINPVIIQHLDKKETKQEGCLSFPGIYCDIERYTHIEIQYYDESFKAHKSWFFDMEARIIQHEIDHINGGGKFIESMEKKQIIYKEVKNL